MDRITGRPDHIEDALIQLHRRQWFMWTDSKNKTYANLRLTEKVGIDGNLVDNLVTELPTEEVVNAKLLELQTDFDNVKTKQETDKTNANQKLKDLGLTDDEIKEIKGIS